MLDDTRRQLGTLARQLDDLLGGRSAKGELADLLLLADGLTEAVLREVARERERSGRRDDWGWDG